VRGARYEKWVIAVDRDFEKQDPGGTPAAELDGRPVQTKVLYDPEALGALIRG